MASEPATVLQPEWLASLPIWLQHRDKVPHYSGLRAPRTRAGDLDTPEDRKRLVALPALRMADGFEPGYALGPVGEHVLCGVDFDKCFGHDGKVVAPLKMFCAVAREAGAMIEVSRSGHGLHVVWLSAPEHVPATFKRPGIECYTGRRFFARGTRIIEPGAPTPLDMRPAFAHLPEPEVRESTPRADRKALVPPGGRNNYLRERLEIFARAGLDGEQLKQALLDENQKLAEPLDDREIHSTLFKGIDKLRIEPVRAASEVFGPFEVTEPPQWVLKPTAVTLVKPAPVRFVIDGWVQESKVGLIASEGGTGKTTLLIQMGVHIVLGREWMGRGVRRGPFILLSRDDDQDDLDAALIEVCLTMMLSESETALVRRELYVQSLRSDPAFMLIQQVERGFKPSAFVPHLQREIGRIKPVCVAIDTVRQFTGIESTDEGGQIVFMSVCAMLASMGPAVIVAHHVGKQAAREKIVDMYSAIGSSALADNARFMWRLLKVDPTDEDVVLPFDMALSPDTDLLQLISTRGSLRVKRPADIWYTRREFVLEQVKGKVLKLSKDEVKDRRASRAFEEALERLVQCFMEIGVVGRDRARAYFKERGWPLSNDLFSQLKSDAEARCLLS